MTGPPETGNYILLDSDGKIWMQYVISNRVSYAINSYLYIDKA